MNQLGAAYTIVVRDMSGKTYRERVGESDSFVKNFLLLVEAGMRDTAMPVIDTGGVARSCKGFSCNVVGGTSMIPTRHIVVGSGTTPVSPDDNALVNQIPETSLAYLPVIFDPVAPTIAGGYIESKIAQRSFVNLSTSPITISEIGIVVKSGSYNVLILRDVLAEPVVVPPGNSIDISYTFKTEVGV